ncbi:hypothetical protein RhiirB3_450332 [Rhizophagus irregularis]|nr:hypothetical protein RhiirB3_450332 [Rhizophagus irregularis]
MVYVIDGICGTHSHTTDNCDDKNFLLDRYNRKIFTKRLIQRETDKIAINSDYKTKFNHVISLNAKTGRQNNSQHPNHPNQTNDHHNNNSQYTPIQQQQYHNTPTNNEMADRIKQLEDQVTNLTNKITNLENAHKHTTTTFTTLQTSHNNMEQNIHTISSRQDQYDTIINKLTANLTKLSDAVTANLTTVKPSK